MTAHLLLDFAQLLFSVAAAAPIVSLLVVAGLAILAVRLN